MADTEELAQGYTLVNDTQYNAGLFLIQKLQITKDMHIVDVGCGTGNLTSYMASLVGKDGKVIGIDPSKERIAIANKNSTLNLKFYEGSAENLWDIPTSGVDIVFVNSTLHWVQNQPAAFREFARVLKRRGKLGISGGSGDYLTAQEIIKGDVLSRERYRGYPEEHGPKFLKQVELESLLDDVALSKRDIVVNSITKSAKNSDEMVNWLDTSSSGKTYGGIPLDLRPSAREEMKVEWDKLMTESGIHMRIDLLVTVATKN